MFTTSMTLLACSKGEGELRAIEQYRAFFLSLVMFSHYINNLFFTPVIACWGFAKSVVAIIAT